MTGVAERSDKDLWGVWPDVNNLKAFHHRGTEDTEKNFLLLTAPQAQLTK